MILQPPESKSVHHMFKRITVYNLKTNLWACKYADESIWSSSYLSWIIINTSISNETKRYMHKSLYPQLDSCSNILFI